MAELAITSQVNAAEPFDLTQARRVAVAEAKTGSLEAGIAQLKQLHQAHPDDMFIVADLIVLLRLAGQNQEIADLTADNKNFEDIPDYARLDLARSLRDLKKFERARAVITGRQQILGPQAQILYAMINIEAGLSKEESLAALPSESVDKLRDVEVADIPASSPASCALSNKNLNAADLANMSYVFRLAGKPAEGLALCLQALQMSPQDPHALREEVYVLSELGAASIALQKAQQNSDLFSNYFMEQLRADVTTIEIRDAVFERLRLDERFLYQVRNKPLEAALNSLQVNRQKFNDPVQALRTRYDQIYVLRSLEMMEQAIAEFKDLPQDPDATDVQTLQTIPAYALTAVADAYLYTRQPDKAASLYEEILAKNPKSHTEIYFALYYAYLDDERYDKAEEILTQINKATPIWLDKQGKSVNRQRAEVDRIWAMNEAYHNRLAVGEERMRQLSSAAPYNASFLNALATIERWRGWPEQAMQTTLLTQPYAPWSKRTRLNLAENNRDLEHFQLWGNQVVSLAQDFPTDTSVKKNLAQWNDRGHFSISSEYTVGNSREEKGNSLLSNRDKELHTRLNSPWIEQGWRAIADQHYIWSSYYEDSLNYNRFGLGAEWRGNRNQFQVMIDNDKLTGDHVGVSADWSQWLNDNWQYAINGNTYSLDTPLRAKEAGWSGKSAATRLFWRQNESREAYLNLGLLSITDGNKRSHAAAGITQRLAAFAHHLTSAGLDLFTEHNSQPGGVYYNPANTQNVSLRLEHLWITWRDYEDSFTQYFKISTGYGWQSDYDSQPAFNLYYEHKWTFARTWNLHSGLGWGNNVYDGEYERRLYGKIGFGGIF